MSSDDAVRVFRHSLHELSDGQLEETAAAYGVAAADNPDVTIDAIAARLGEAGAIAELVGSPEVYRLLVRLLEVGDIQPVRVLRLAPFGQSKELHEEFVGKLIALRFILIRSTDDEQIVVLQPWLRILLADEIAKEREAVRAVTIPEFTESVAAHHRIVLCANYLRGLSLRITTKGEIYQRDRDRGEALFEPAGPESDFDTCIRSLERLDCLATTDGQLRLVAERARDLFTSASRAIGIELLLENRWEAPLDFEILASLRRHLADGLGWVPYGHLAGDVITFLAPRPNYGYSNSIERVRDELLKLQILGFVAWAEPPGESERYGRFCITTMGLDVFESLACELPELEIERGALQAVAGHADADGRAIFQPNLDVLVPVEAPPWVHWKVGGVARLESVDAMCRYAIDKDWAQCVFGREGDGDVEAWLAELEGASEHEIPENITRTLESWLGSQGRVRVSKGVVIALDESAGDAARSALTDAAKKLKARLLAPGVYVLESSKKTVAAVSASLEQLGLRVDGFEGKRREETAARARLRAGDNAAGELLGRYRQDRELLAEFLHDIDPIRELEIEKALEATGEGEDARERVEIDDEDEGMVFTFGTWIDRDGPPRPEISPTVSSTIHEAVRSRRAVQLIVDNPELSSWTIIPSNVVKRGAGVYVSGFCPDTSEHRVFPMSGIMRVRSSRERFS